MSNTVQRKQSTVVVCVSAGEMLPNSDDRQPLRSLLHVLPGQGNMSDAIFRITAQNNHFDVASDRNYIF